MRRTVPIAGMLCSVLFGVATAASTQPLSPPVPVTSAVSVEPLTPEQERELDTWLSAMDKWRHNELKWRNRPQRDAWGRITGRRPLPDAPSWLAAYCASVTALDVAGLNRRTEQACQVLADPLKEAGTPQVQAKASQAVAEKPDKHTSFLTRLHLDGLWTTTAIDGRVYGLVGSHVSLVDIGRLQVFGPPGVLLVSVPDGKGSRRVTLGYTWGLSVRLMNVRLCAGKDMTLFVNVSKVWVAGSGGQGLDIVGFSLATRRKK